MGFCLIFYKKRLTFIGQTIKGNVLKNSDLKTNFIGLGSRPEIEKVTKNSFMFSYPMIVLNH